METDKECPKLEDIDLPGLAGGQREAVLELVIQIRADIGKISTEKFEVGIKMARVYEITGHGSFDALWKKFFPKLPKRSIQRYLAVGRTFGPHRDMVIDIGFSDLGKLAEQANLSSLRSELIEQIQRGEIADGHVYRAKIAELLKENEDGSLDDIDRIKMENNSKKEALKNINIVESNIRHARLDDGVKDIIDETIPNDPELLQRLWDVISTKSTKEQVMRYWYGRIRDLVGNSMSQPTNNDSGVDSKFLSQI